MGLERREDLGIICSRADLYVATVGEFDLQMEDFSTFECWFSCLYVS
jgi:hypothetical protein